VLVVVLVAIIGLAVVAGWQLTRHGEASRERGILRDGAVQAQNAVRAAADAELSSLERIRSAVNGELLADPVRFAAVAAPLTDRTGLAATGLARVDSDRVVTVARAPVDGLLIRAGVDVAAVARRRLALDIARDTGGARLTEAARGSFPGPPAQLVVSPVYGPGPPPTGVEQRREQLRGYVLGVLRPSELVRAAVDPAVARRMLLRIDDGPIVLYQSGASRSTPLLQNDVSVGGRTWRFTAWPAPGALAGDPAGWLIYTEAVGFLALLALLGWALHRSDAEGREALAGREQQLRLIVDAGPLLQQSLDLGELLPAFALEVADQLGLERVGIAIVGEEGGLVEIFTLGPTRERADKAVDLRSSPTSVAAGIDFNVPLQRTGRTIGALRLRSRKALGSSEMTSLRAVADLLAAALGNAQLYWREQETVRRLQEVDRLKVSFLSTVSHELRTAVTAIEGFGALLEEHWPTLSDEQRREFIGRIARNASSLKVLVDDLLDFARLERQALSVAPRLVSLSDLVRDIADQLATLFENHRLEFEIAPDVRAFTDPAAVERILGNFLSNAAKYSPPGTAVTVAVGRAGSRAMLSVSDQGPGIPAEERTRIFTRFYRSDTVQTRGTRGAGIGLAVVKEFADRLNASLVVESAPGGGARFVAMFPTEPGDAIEPDALARARPGILEGERR
jgi:signal transduction histidine kinase